MRWMRTLAAVGITAMVFGCGSDRSTSERRLPPVRLASSLVEFNSCAGLLDWVKQTSVADLERVEVVPVEGAAPRADADGTAAATAETSTAPLSSSTTNNQVANVDEADTVKTDGRVLVALQPNLRIVDVRTGTPTPIVELPVTGDQLFLTGNTVVVLGDTFGDAVSTNSTATTTDAATANVIGAPAGVRVTSVDITDPSNPQVRSALTIDGYRTSARLADGKLRLVLTHTPALASPLSWRESRDEALAERKRRIADSRLEDWIPRATRRTGDAVVSEGPIAECARAYRPDNAPRSVGTVSVLTVDPTTLDTGSPVTVFGAGETVYASERNVFVAQSVGGFDGHSAPQPTVTDVHRFSVDGAAPEYHGSGRVTGRLLNQYSMDEYRGHLRVAFDEESNGADAATDANGVAVLAIRDRELVTVGTVGGLARGESIHAVRFMGDRGYVVTAIERRDPLFVLDLADPANPRTTGELKIPGYSAYLHPITDTLLLGVGQDGDLPDPSAPEPGAVEPNATDPGVAATGDGGAAQAPIRQSQRAKLSLFDVRDPANPVEVTKLLTDDASFAAEWDPHAFLYWGPNRLVALPTAYGALACFTLDADNRTVARTGTVEHPKTAEMQPMITRSLVIGDRLVSVSNAGVQANDLASLAPTAWMSW